MLGREEEEINGLECRFYPGLLIVRREVLANLARFHSSPWKNEVFDSKCCKVVFFYSVLRLYKQRDQRIYFLSCKEKCDYIVC